MRLQQDALAPGCNNQLRLCLASVRVMSHSVLPPTCLQEALLALNEAVRIAQQHNDNAALAHALAALCRILGIASPQAVAQLTEPSADRCDCMAHLSQLLKILRR